MKRSLIVIISILAGYALATVAVVFLILAGINIPTMFATSPSQYSTYGGVEVLLLTIGMGWSVYQPLAHRFLADKVGGTSLLDRIRTAARHPTVTNLVVAWFVAFFTIVLYPLAFYMSWRFFIERRNADTKVCPRCAERIKAAALVCRHCSQEFETTIATLGSAR